MMQPTRAAFNGVTIFRVTTVTSLILTFGFFIAGDGGDLPRTLVFMAWLALCAFNCIRIVSDLLSRQNIKAQRFQNTLDAIVANAGDEATARRSFYTMQLIAGAVKLAVPAVLWVMFL